MAAWLFNFPVRLCQQLSLSNHSEIDNSDLSMVIKTSYRVAFIDILGAGMADSRVAENLEVQGVGTYRDFDT